MTYRHSLTKGQAFEVRRLLGERADIDRQIQRVLNIAVIDSGLPKGEWDLDTSDPNELAIRAELPTATVEALFGEG